MPFRELGFFGVPHRTNSFIMPTVNCLVELTELPFTVMTLGGACQPCTVLFWAVRPAPPS